MQSASQALRQEREQPPSAHTSASCARLEPAKSTRELFRIFQGASAREGTDLEARGDV